MKYTQTCECCNHQETAYTFTLNEGRLSGLKKLLQFWNENKTGATMKDLGLTNSEYTNFCHLKYWNFARKTSDGWFPTRYGKAFVEGKETAYNMVATLNKEVLPFNHEAWDTHTKKPEQVLIYSYFPNMYEPKEKYQEEKGSNQFTIC